MVNKIINGDTGEEIIVEEIRKLAVEEYKNKKPTGTKYIELKEKPVDFTKIPEIKEAERIAKEIGGHIPERVVDDGLLKRR